MEEIKKYEGLVAAPFTPLHNDGTLNTDLIPQYYRLLEKNGITGAFINGSTGEGVSLTQAEKHILIEKWTSCYRESPTVRIITLVGGTSYSECIENAIFSSQCGVSAVAIVPPYYFKPPDVIQLAEFCTRVGESVPDMPVYLYHIPSLAGFNLPMLGFMEQITTMLPNFAGIKYTDENFMDFLSCLNFKGGKYDLLWGRDECMLSALVLGTKGAVGSTFNYAAPLYNKLIKAFEAGNLKEARQLQQLSVDMVTILGKYGGIATGKAFMKYIGLDCGKFRSPVKNMEDSIYKAFEKDVRLLNMDELFSKI